MLSTDWYRFSGAAGNQMAESCVDNNRCGTYYPGWLSGSHPTVNEGAVQRRVCFSYYVYGDCCSLSTYIRVRNCGGFFVYQLKPLTVCNSRYCGNGYGSSTPTTPGTVFPSFCFFLFEFHFHSADDALGIHRWKNKLLALKWWKRTAAILAYCHPPLPLHPTNKPSNGRIHPQPLTTTVWLKYWFSVVKTLSEPKIFNSPLN